MRKKSILLFAALSLFAACIVSCGDDELEKRPINAPSSNGFDGSIVSSDGSSSIEIKSTVQGMSGTAYVPKSAAQHLIEKGWGGLLVIWDGSSNANYGKMPNKIELKSQSFTSLEVSTINCYPENVVFEKEPIEITLNTTYLKGLNPSFYYESDKSPLEVTYGENNVSFKTFKLAPINISVNGSVEVLKTEVVEGPAKATISKGVLTFGAKYGIETETDNYIVESAVGALIGGYNYMCEAAYEIDAVDNVVDITYSQEVTTFAVTIGEKTYNFKAYSKPEYKIGQ